MKVSREQMAANRQRILEAASEQFRAKGFGAVSIADVMNAAGLTHGGFYGHFKSKDDLVAQTIAHTLTASLAGAFDLDTFLDKYLAPRHRDNATKGCPTASLAAETRHQTTPARAAMTNGQRAQIERIAKQIPGKNAAKQRRAAIGSWSAMVGALILARALDDRTLSDEVLEQTRAWISEAIK